jgi:hypothetical protein
LSVRRDFLILTLHLSECALNLKAGVWKRNNVAAIFINTRELTLEYRSTVRSELYPYSARALGLDDHEIPGAVIPKHKDRRGQNDIVCMPSKRYLIEKLHA